MKDSFLMFKKEMTAILRDKRLILTVTLIPFLFIPAIFYVNGMGQWGKEQKKFVIAYNKKVPFISFLDKNKLQTVKIVDKNNALNFDAWDVYLYKPSTDTSNPIVYVNAKNSDVNGIVKTLERYYLSFKNSYIKDKLKAMNIPVEKVLPENIKIVRVNEENKTIISFLLPFLILVYLFANAMGVGLDSIAGEKERNTLQLLLVSRISRNSILYGKLFSTMIISLTGAVFSILGLIFAYLLKFLPAIGNSTLNMTPVEFILFSLIIITLDMLIVSLLIVVSSYSKTVKEGQGYILPIYFIVIILGMAAINPSSAIAQNFSKWPFMDSLLSMQSILNGTIPFSLVIETLILNITLTAIILKITTLLFNNESIIFRK